MLVTESQAGDRAGATGQKSAKGHRIEIRG